VTAAASGAADDRLAIPIPGCGLELVARPSDPRGWFAKVFQASAVRAAGGDPTVAEVYLSSSHRGVIRGLHYQLPPHDHAKTVSCVRGEAYDVVLDARRGSPTFGRVAAFALHGAEPGRLHIPAGCAHGFQALADDTVLVYVVGTEHSPEHDSGVRWDSVGVRWPLPDPIVSARDRALPAFDPSATPFRFP
jgi:dTDP-4-dehydrorhamnose 3,5-epimerase